MKVAKLTSFHPQWESLQNKLNTVLERAHVDGPVIEYIKACEDAEKDLVALKAIAKAAFNISSKGERKAVKVTVNDPDEGISVHEYASRQEAAKHYAAGVIKEMILDVRVLKFEVLVDDPCVIKFEVEGV